MSADKKRRSADIASIPLHAVEIHLRQAHSQITSSTLTSAPCRGRFRNAEAGDFVSAANAPAC
jgi:hypothetical protein